MNELDSTFERFARRFGAIEGQVPRSGPGIHPPSASPRSTVSWSLLAAMTGIIVVVVALAIGAHHSVQPLGPAPRPSSQPTPTTSAAPSATPISSGPVVTCDPEPQDYTVNAQGSEVPIPVLLHCADAVAAAVLRFGGSAGVGSIEFHYGSYCPPGEFCVFRTDDRGYVVVHRVDGSEATIEVEIKADGTIGTSPLEPYPPFTPVPAPRDSAAP